MQIRQYTRYGHRILHIEERVGLTSDIGCLREALKQAWREGHIHVAVSFTEGSFLSSRTLALLIESAEKATARGGSFTVIAPNTQIREVLAIFDLEWTLRTVTSENELLVSPVNPVT
ncbi:MAG: hypothetical protein GF418_11015 [Chitinivibrionales bacterium]|nr:hypothetical protein [Chitinivibrionales bacterium]MBD3396146.1 hypothetical protein [Chitinivibrionales bacterium]